MEQLFQFSPSIDNAINVDFKRYNREIISCKSATKLPLSFLKIDTRGAKSTNRNLKSGKNV